MDLPTTPLRPIRSIRPPTRRWERFDDPASILLAECFNLKTSLPEWLARDDRRAFADPRQTPRPRATGVRQRRPVTPSLRRLGRVKPCYAAHHCALRVLDFLSFTPLQSRTVRPSALELAWVSPCLTCERPVSTGALERDVDDRPGDSSCAFRRADIRMRSVRRVPTPRGCRAREFSLGVDRDRKSIRGSDGAAPPPS